jgi:hypothetical protein
MVTVTVIMGITFISSVPPFIFNVTFLLTDSFMYLTLTGKCKQFKFYFAHRKVVFFVRFQVVEISIHYYWQATG